MAMSLSSTIAAWSPQEKIEAFTMLLMELRPKDSTAEERAEFRAKIRARCSVDRPTLTPEAFLRQLD